MNILSKLAMICILVILLILPVVGCTGPQGLQGPIGSTGLQGPIGPAGLQGPIGPAGSQGSVGPAGPVGLRGLAGPVGPAGSQGSVGPAGPVGLRGLAGPVGPVGPQGPPGPAGPAGSISQVVVVNGSDTNLAAVCRVSVSDHVYVLGAGFNEFVEKQALITLEHPHFTRIEVGQVLIDIDGMVTHDFWPSLVWEGYFFSLCVWVDIDNDSIFYEDGELQTCWPLYII